MMLALRVALVAAIAALAGYAAWEFWRWRRPDSEPLVSPLQKRLRAAGFFFLLLVLGLWLHGTYLPTPRTRLALAHLLGYWMVTAIAIVPLIPLALLDARENLHRALRDRRRLRETLLAPSESRKPES